MQSEPVHHTVEQDGEARQVPHVLEYAEHQIEREDIGEHHADRDEQAGGEQSEGLHEVDDHLAVHGHVAAYEQVVKEASAAERIGKGGDDRAPERLEQRLHDEADDGLPDEAHRREGGHDDEYAEKGAGHRTYARVLEPVAPRVVTVLDALDLGDDRSHLGPHIFRGVVRPSRRAERLSHAVDKFLHPDARHRRRRYHGNAEAPLEGLRVDGDAEVAGLVPQVECHYHRQAKLTELQGECQVALEIGGIEHVHDETALAEYGAGHLLGRAGGVERVGAWHIDDREGAVAKAHGPFEELHGGARIVRAHRAHTGQP